MLRLIFKFSLLFFLFQTLIGGCSKESSTGPPIDPDVSIELSTLVPVIPVSAEGRSNLVYELIIQNQSDQLIAVTKVEILDGNSQIAAYEDDALEDRLTENSATLFPNAEKILFLWL